MSAQQLPKSEHEIFVEKALALQAQELQQNRELLRAILQELQSINAAIVNRV
ncbi:MAG: hypothetical protein ABSG45_02335 [Nitrososphaerales archaeon]|jgi:hypothetical protein